MKKTISAFLVLCLSVVFISCQAWSPAGKPAPITSRQCLPSFPDQNGWYGGDGAYSICLDEKRTL